MYHPFVGQVSAFSKSLRAFSPSYRMKADPIQHMCFNSWFLVCRKKMDSQILEQVKKIAQVDTGPS